MAIKETAFVPKIDRKKSETQKMVWIDLQTAIKSKITTFEFDGSYNYNTLAPIVKEVGDKMFMKMYYDCLEDIRAEVSSELAAADIYDKRKVWVAMPTRYLGTYVKVQTRKLEGRVHVYATIDYKLAERLKDIIKQDTIDEYVSKHPGVSYENGRFIKEA